MNPYITPEEQSGLSRDVYPLPEFVDEALQAHDLVEEYCSRPPYQKNDYIGWIMRAKREATRQKRLNQMLDELRDGDRYMNMEYTPKE